MRRFVALLRSLSVVILVVVTTSAQVTESEPQTESEIAGLLGSDAEAMALISDELKHVGSVRRDGVAVLSRQIRDEWVPQMDGVEFLRLSDADAVKRLASCETSGTYWLVLVSQLDGGMVRITTTEKCGGVSYVARFERHEGQWRVPGVGPGMGWARAIASGLTSIPPECECLKRRLDADAAASKE
jgi:hypothetical protein